MRAEKDVGHSNFVEPFNSARLSDVLLRRHQLSGLHGRLVANLGPQLSMLRGRNISGLSQLSSGHSTPITPVKPRGPVQPAGTSFAALVSTT